MVLEGEELGEELVISEEYFWCDWTLFSSFFPPPPPPTDCDINSGLVLGDVKVTLGGEDPVGVVTEGLNEWGGGVTPGDGLMRGGEEDWKEFEASSND